MVDAAEDALKAIQERDSLITQLKQLQQTTQNAEPKDDNAVITEDVISPVEESVTRVGAE